MAKCCWQNHEAGDPEAAWHGLSGYAYRVGVKLPGLRTRPWLCYFATLLVFPSLIWGNGDNRPYPIAAMNIKLMNAKYLKQCLPPRKHSVEEVMIVIISTKAEEEMMVKIAKETGGDGEVHVVAMVSVAEVEKPLEMTGQPECGCLTHVAGKAPRWCQDGSGEEDYGAGIQVKKMRPSD